MAVDNAGFIDGVLFLLNFGELFLPLGEELNSCLIRLGDMNQPQMPDKDLQKGDKYAVSVTNQQYNEWILDQYASMRVSQPLAGSVLVDPCSLKLFHIPFPLGQHLSSPILLSIEIWVNPNPKDSSKSTNPTFFPSSWQHVHQTSWFKLWDFQGPKPPGTWMIWSTWVTLLPISRRMCSWGKRQKPQIRFLAGILTGLANSCRHHIRLFWSFLICIWSGHIWQLHWLLVTQLGTGCKAQGALKIPTQLFSFDVPAGWSQWSHPTLMVFTNRVHGRCHGFILFSNTKSYSIHNLDKYS